jgi:pilus assembly protein CpaB
MNKRLVTVMLFALLVSGAASAFMYRLVTRKAAARPVEHTNKVVVAAYALKIGTLLRPDDLKLADWPGPIPDGALRTIDSAAGRGVIEPIYPSEAVIENRLAPKGAGAGLAATIPSGMRAVAVRVNELVGVSGFVLPGMRVDVIIAGSPPGGSGAATGTMSKTILQNIEVLSAGPKFQRDAEGKPVSVPVVNLLVTPQQAEALTLASNEMRIQLVLRNPLDKDVAHTPGTDIANLFADSAAVRMPQPGAQTLRTVARTYRPVVARAHSVPAEPILVEVISGTKRTELKFDRREENR